MRRRKGFTMIELLVVIAIIGLLATGAIGVYVNAQKASRNARRRSDMKDFQNALEQYFADNQQYPPGGGNNCNDLVTAGNDYFKDNTLPKETRPSSARYIAHCNNTQYCICAELEEVGKDVGNVLNPPGAGVASCAFVDDPNALYHCVTNLQ